ncbi:hypothetical protein ElyMa_004569100 [Elysia marginata]|uniref:Uncharacterized protein n=1 Tax=Elysia marginata TaxID=1093978 RepID=A0AAV4HW74_9GAST|nr:hypothetical protein ElyMa_004569100 [Elysia marginata]
MLTNRRLIKCSADRLTNARAGFQRLEKMCGAPRAKWHPRLPYHHTALGPFRHSAIFPLRCLVFFLQFLSKRNMNQVRKAGSWLADEWEESLLEEDASIEGVP